jgi:hypothetical protein
MCRRTVPAHLPAMTPCGSRRSKSTGPSCLALPTGDKATASPSPMSGKSLVGVQEAATYGANHGTAYTQHARPSRVFSFSLKHSTHGFSLSLSNTARSPATRGFSLSLKHSTHARLTLAGFLLSLSQTHSNMSSIRPPAEEGALVLSLPLPPCRGRRSFLRRARRVAAGTRACRSVLGPSVSLGSCVQARHTVP